jgi:hypothetical protein
MNTPQRIFDQPPNPSAPVGAPPYELASPFAIASDSTQTEETQHEQIHDEPADQKTYIPPARPALKKMILTAAKPEPLLAPKQKTAPQLSLPISATRIQQWETIAPETKQCVIPAPRPQVISSPVPETSPPVEVNEAPATALEMTDTFSVEIPTIEATPKINHALLCAIFGASQDMSAAEIWARCKQLPSILQLEILNQNETGTHDDFKHLLTLHQFGTQPRISYGETPVELIHEGGVTIAVKTNGGFARGVRETLIIVARELGTALI